MRPKQRLRKRARLEGPTPPPSFPGRRDPWNREFFDHLREHRHGHRRWRAHRSGFFMRISGFFFILSLALILILSTGDGFTWEHLSHALGWIALIFFVALMGLRRMFGPMRHLIGGVQEIAKGNLDFRFPPKDKGEFDFLAFNFNHMAGRVQEMMRSKEQLLLDVSHEMRSPLARLKLALEMTPPGKMRESMGQDIQEMETMLAEILETEHLKSRYGGLDLTPLDLSKIIADIALKYDGRKPGLAPAKLDSVLWVSADEARIRTLFQNVLENALKYSARQSKPVEISGALVENFVVIQVRDFGVGIPPEEREKVFEPFYRVDKSRIKETGGYGLGLSLWREIMKAHGGEIALANAPPPGSQIILKFPKLKSPG